MILADRQQLSQFSKKRAVVIRQREVDMLHDSFSVLATQCAFLVAIAFVSLYMQPDTIDLFIANECGVLKCHETGTCCIPPPGMSKENITALIVRHKYTECDEIAGAKCEEPHKKPDHNMELAFFTCSALSACCNLFAVVLATYGMVFGPALAIRGPEGSMSRAIDAMYATRRMLLRTFWAGLLFFMLSIPFLGFMKLDTITATLMTLCTMACLALIVQKATLTRHKFAFDRRRQKFLVGQNFDPERRRTVAQLPPVQRRAR